MDLPLAIARVLHIVSGTFWVGTAIYLAVLLEPRIRSGSIELERELLSRTSKLNSLWITGSAIVAILSGFALISMTPGRSMSDLGSGGWGTMILIGLLTSFAAFFVSGFAGAATARLRRGLEATNTVSPELEIYRRRLSLLGYLNAVFVVVAVGSMSVARFV